MPRIRKYHNPHHAAAYEVLLSVRRSDLEEPFTRSGSHPLAAESTTNTLQSQVVLETMLNKLRIEFTNAMDSDWSSRPKISPVEDDEQEAVERRKRAHLAALDAKCIMQQSSVAYPAFRHQEVAVYKVVDNQAPGDLDQSVYGLNMEIPQQQRFAPPHYDQQMGMVRA
ncbi:hypothetical protein RhiJN_17825 [Ceratobasidium sp. AG-Ba]|nr:hypothetical protein RhiJN_17825 [Ceratobasidium sp. AG-Ba]